MEVHERKKNKTKKDQHKIEEAIFENTVWWLIFFGLGFISKRDYGVNGETKAKTKAN